MNGCVGKQPSSCRPDDPSTTQTSSTTWRALSSTHLGDDHDALSGDAQLPDSLAHGYFAFTISIHLGSIECGDASFPASFDHGLCRLGRGRRTECEPA